MSASLAQGRETFRTYLVLILFSLLSLLVLVGVAYVRDFSEQKQIRLQFNFNAFENQHRTLLEQITDTAHYIEGMRIVMPALATSALHEKRNKEILEALANKRTRIDLDSRHSANVGNIIVPAQSVLQSHGLAAEIHATLGVVPHFTAAIDRLPGISNVFYLSRKGFIHFFPWREASSIHLSDAFHNNGYLQAAEQRGQDYSGASWTRPYIDRAGHGWVATCYAGVWLEDSFRGVLGMDLKLRALTSIIDEGMRFDGRYWLIDEEGQQLNLPLNGAEPPLLPRLATAYGPELATAILNLPDTRKSHVLQHGHYIAREKLAGTSWSFVHVLPEGELNDVLLQDYDKDFFLVIALLALVLVVPHWVIRREMIQPIRRLVDFIETGEAPSASRPLPKRWRPWFERIQTLLRDHQALGVLRQEMAIARQIQQSLVPAAPLSGEDWRIEGMMRPANEVGGDAFDYFALPDGRVVFLIADVSGKGVSAALYMSAMRVLMRALSKQGGSPAEWLGRANDYLVQDNPSTMFVTACVGVFSPADARVCLANAGHLPPALADASGVALQKQVPLPALGVIPGIAYQETVFVLSPGSALLLFTDGVTEAASADGDLFGNQRLLDLLQSNECQAWLSVTEQAIVDFSAGVAQSDDITALLLMKMSGWPKD